MKTQLSFIQLSVHFYKVGMQFCSDNLCIYVITYFSKKGFLCAHYVPGTVLGAEKRTKSLFLWCLLTGEG